MEYKGYKIQITQNGIRIWKEKWSMLFSSETEAMEWIDEHEE